jgi:hypothetical protein
MKSMKKYCLVILFVFVFSGLIKAQNYETAIGIRGGFAPGLTVKHFLTDKTAVEGIFSTRWGGFMITGLYEIEAPAFDTEGLSWYYGGGAHIGFWNSSNSGNPWWEDDHNDNYTILGIDGIIGLSYTFAEIPINVSIDWKPMINFVGYSGFWGDMAAISVRYTIK